MDTTSHLCDAERPENHHHHNNTDNKKHMLCRLDIQWPAEKTCVGQEVTWRNFKPVLSPCWRFPEGRGAGGTGTGTEPTAARDEAAFGGKAPFGGKSTFESKAPLEAKHLWRQSSRGGRGVHWGWPCQDQADGAQVTARQWGHCDRDSSRPASSFALLPAAQHVLTPIN